MEGELPVAVEIEDTAAAAGVEVGSALRGGVTVTIASGRGGVALSGPLFDVARLVVGIDRQLSHLLVERRRRVVGAA